MKGSSSKFCKVKCQVHTKLQSPNTPNAMQMEGPEYVYLQVFSIVCPGLSFSLSRVSVWHEPQICFPRKLTCFSKACLVLQTILTLTFTKLGLFKSMSFPSLVLPFFAFWLTNWTVLLRGDMQSICLVHRTWKSLRGHSISAFQHAVQVVAG